MTRRTKVDSIPMRLAKVVALGSEDGSSFCVVLQSTAGDARLPISIGETEGIYLSASLAGTQFARPMSPQFAAGLLQALGGRVRQVRIDRVLPVSGGNAYGATVEVEGASGVQLVDARPSDALSLVALTPAPILVAPEVLADGQARLAGKSAEAVELRQAIAAPQVARQRSRFRR